MRCCCRSCSFEIAVFAAIGTNFLHVGERLRVSRLSVEVGLLSLALTPVIVTGGIDLSVGSLMGLSAVVFGKLWRDGFGTVADSARVRRPRRRLCWRMAGGLNGAVDHAAALPPLIVTLGTFSLFRGLAEGMTRRRR